MVKNVLPPREKPPTFLAGLVLHVAEEVGGEMRTRGQIRIGLPSRTLAPGLDMLRAPVRKTSSGPINVRPALRVDVKYFGRHKGGALRDAVVRGVSVAG
jgi:hypothetical protein